MKVPGKWLHRNKSELIALIDNPHRREARFQRSLFNPLALAARNSCMSEPVLIPTGQELSHSPSTAQDSSTAYCELSESSLKSAVSPLSCADARALRRTMRCLGVVVISLL